MHVNFLLGEVIAYLLVGHQWHLGLLSDRSLLDNWAGLYMKMKILLSYTVIFSFFSNQY